MTYREALQIFGFSVKPEMAVLDKQYKKLMRKWHPDFSTEANASEMSSKLNIAYNVLKNGKNVVAEPQKPTFRQFTHASIFRIVPMN